MDRTSGRADSVEVRRTGTDYAIEKNEDAARDAGLNCARRLGGEKMASYVRDAQDGVPDRTVV